MILPDVNLLVYAVDTASPFHAQARRWWEEVLSSDQPVGLCYTSLLGFVRLTTNRRVVESPFDVGQALEMAESWLEQPNVRLLAPTGRHWPILSGLLRSVPGGAGLITDAHMAAYAIEHGYTLYSNDSDFGRFDELRWKNPLTWTSPNPPVAGLRLQSQSNQCRQPRDWTILPEDRRLERPTEAVEEAIMPVRALGEPSGGRG